MMRLCVITVLTGTLAVVGCSDDENGGGGTGGAGATGGTGATGGAGGTGGDVTCEQTCGVDNEFPTGAPEVSELFTCSVMGITIGLEMAFAGVEQSEPVGDVDAELSLQTIISAGTVNLITALADSADITATTAIANPGADTTGDPADFVLSGTPCVVCFERDVEVNVVIDPTTGSYTGELDGQTDVNIELSEVTVEIDAAGIALILSNSGDDPACCWGDDCEAPAAAPVLSLPIPQPMP